MVDRQWGMRAESRGELVSDGTIASALANVVMSWNETNEFSEQEVTTSKNFRTCPRKVWSEETSKGGNQYNLIITERKYFALHQHGTTFFIRCRKNQYPRSLLGAVWGSSYTREQIREENLATLLYLHGEKKNTNSPFSLLQPPFKPTTLSFPPENLSPL